jgi:hypothetical protein
MRFFVFFIFLATYELVINNILYIFFPLLLGVIIYLFIYAINNKYYFILFSLIFINSIIETANELPLFILSFFILLSILGAKHLFNISILHRYSVIYGLLILNYLTLYIFANIFFNNNSQFKIVSLEILFMYYFLLESLILYLSKAKFTKYFNLTKGKNEF